jgi:hypothetical protein
VRQEREILTREQLETAKQSGLSDRSPLWVRERRAAKESSLAVNAMKGSKTCTCFGCLFGSSATCAVLRRWIDNNLLTSLTTSLSSCPAFTICRSLLQTMRKVHE